MITISSAPTQASNSSTENKDIAQVLNSTSAKTQHSPLTKKTVSSFEATMAETTRLMPAPQRAFSRIIHTKTVAILSDIIGGTLTRPNALLSGAVFSFGLTLVVYLLSKNLGYGLSGFESIGAFIVGWLLGITYDFLKLLNTTTKH